MTFGELVLAASLLMGSPPAELQEPEALRTAYPTLRLSLVRLALDWEILDPRETRYVLARENDIKSDLQLLQGRYRDLHDAPPLSDSFRFPDRTVVNELLVFNRSYRSCVEQRQPNEVANSWELRSTLREVDHLYQVWDTVRDARCEYYYVHVRRQALKRLLELLGDEAYYQGELPPHVPVWRFQKLN